MRHVEVATHQLQCGKKVPGQRGEVEGNGPPGTVFVIGVDVHGRKQNDTLDTMADKDNREVHGAILSHGRVCQDVAASGRGPPRACCRSGPPSRRGSHSMRAWQVTSLRSTTAKHSTSKTINSWTTKYSWCPTPPTFQLKSNSLAWRQRCRDEIMRCSNAWVQGVGGSSRVWS